MIAKSFPPSTKTARSRSRSAASLASVALVDRDVLGSDGFVAQSEERLNVDIVDMVGPRQRYVTWLAANTQVYDPLVEWQPVEWRVRLVRTSVELI